MRPIDADALKFRDVKVTTNEIDIFGFGGYLTKQCKGILQEEIWNTPTIDAVPKWVPCEERLPEEYNEYLCCDKRGDYYLNYLEDAEWAREFTKNESIIAWMPLPKPYTEERKDDE